MSVLILRVVFKLPELFDRKKSLLNLLAKSSLGEREREIMRKIYHLVSVISKKMYIGIHGYLFAVYNDIPRI